MIERKGKKFRKLFFVSTFADEAVCPFNLSVHLITFNYDIQHSVFWQRPKNEPNSILGGHL